MNICISLILFSASIFGFTALDSNYKRSVIHNTVEGNGGIVTNPLAFAVHAFIDGNEGTIASLAGETVLIEPLHGGLPLSQDASSSGMIDTELLAKLKVAIDSASILSVPPGCPKGELILDATGYSSTPDQTDDTPFETATGTPVHWGTVAVDPAVVPLGCRMTLPQFPGVIFTAEDTGSAIIGHRLDIWNFTREEALEWGVQTITVTVL